MFDVFLEHVKKLLKSRLFPITLIYLALFFIIINQLFVLQIVKGPVIVEENELRVNKPREIKSTRGNIYDRKGKLLAHDVLTYSVMMEDSTKIESDEQKNEIINKLVKIIEKNGDTLDTEFYIAQNDKGELEFTIKDPALTRFKKKVYSYVLEDGKLTDAQKNATAKEVFDFLCNGTGNAYTRMFEISDQYTTQEALKIMSVRYALFLNWPKYLQITVASNISDTTIAAVEENSADLVGVEIQQQTHRVYEDSLYFAHILGYTGLISSEELDELNTDDSDYYNSTDIIGKTGLERVFENELGGTKGSEFVSVNVHGNVVDVISRTDPVAGNDIYLTIDSDLQRSVYHLLEKELALILLRNITSELDYGSKGESASEILIPIYEVYNALIENNIIDTDQFDDPDATALEKQTYQKYQTTLKHVFDQLDTLLSMNSTTPNNEAEDMEQYLNYFYKVLIDHDILNSNNIPLDDSTLLDYKNHKISLSSLLQYALSNNWVDLSKLEVGNEYYSAEELYQKLITSTKEILKSDDNFNKMIYHDLVFSYNLSGTEICLLLFDQDVLKYKEEEINKLKNGGISAYTFITDKIKALEITPAMLALEPCSGAVVITDVNNGNVLAMVTYPSYDTNLITNKADANYYAKILNDKSQPILNRAINVRTAPGSTFKMVTSFAALEEGITTPTKEIVDLGIFDRSDPPAKCHIYPGTHGSVNIVDALKVSCNYYYYEMGWGLSIDNTGKFNQLLGLSRLKKYATLFGLNEPAGIELHESEPQISDSDSVRSSIGQGSNVYTPLQLSRYVTTLANHGTCYDLTLLDMIKDKDGKIIKDNSAKVNHKLTGIQSTTWDSVYEGMYSVANVYGGSVYSNFKDFGVTVAGKTGTSQISKVDPNNALFVSFAPYQAPEISVTAVIPNGYTSHNAAELSKAIYSLYFNLDKEENLLNGENAESDSNIDAYLE